jgi:hypothetical protein
VDCRHVFHPLEKYLDMDESLNEASLHSTVKSFGYKYYGPETEHSSGVRSGQSRYMIKGRDEDHHHVVVVNSSNGGSWFHSGPGGMSGSGKDHTSMVSHLSKVHPGTIRESAPPGFEGTVRAMKGKSGIDNPYALAWSMKNKGYKSHRKADGSPKEESASCPQCGCNETVWSPAGVNGGRIPEGYTTMHRL